MHFWHTLPHRFKANFPKIDVLFHLHIDMNVSQYHPWYALVTKGTVLTPKQRCGGSYSELICFTICQAIKLWDVYIVSEMFILHKHHIKCHQHCFSPSNTLYSWKRGYSVAALKLYFALLFTVNLIWPCTGLCEWLKESSKLLDVFNELLSCVSDIIVWNMKMKLCMFNEGQIKCDRTELYHLCYSSCLKIKRWEYRDFF